MFLLSRRQTRAAMSAAAGAAVYLAASEIGKDRLKMTGLFILASASMAGLVTAQSSSKAKNVEQRFNHLLTNGGTFGGTVTVNGNHIVTGSGQFGGPLTSVGTGGDAQQGAFDDSDADSALSGAGTTWETGAQNRINHLITDHNALNADAIAIKNRVNHYIAVLG